MNYFKLDAIGLSVLERFTGTDVLVFLSLWDFFYYSIIYLEASVSFVFPNYRQKKFWFVHRIDLLFQRISWILKSIGIVQIVLHSACRNTVDADNLWFLFNFLASILGSIFSNLLFLFLLLITHLFDCLICYLLLLLLFCSLFNLRALDLFELLFLFLLSFHSFFYMLLF